MVPATFASRSLATAGGGSSVGKRLGVPTRPCPGDLQRLAHGKSIPPAIRLTLNDPAKWTITVLGPDERPIGRLRLVPHSFQRTDGRTARRMVVDAALEEPLTVTTDDKGIASLAYLDANMAPLSIGIVGAGFAPHTLPLDTPLEKNVVLKLGRPGRVVGIVRTASGQPLAGVPVELWVQGSGTLPGDIRFVVDGRITGDAIIRLDQAPLKTGPHGAFQTPSTLLNGSTYRVSIRKRRVRTLHFQLGYAEWRLAAIPDIRLKPLQKLTGQINDRQGHAVAGAGLSCRLVAPRLPTTRRAVPDRRASIPARPSFWSKKRGFGFRAGWSIRRHRPSWVR